MWKGRFLFSTRLDFIAYAQGVSLNGTPGLCICRHLEWSPASLRALRFYQMLVAQNSPLTQRQASQNQFLTCLANNFLWRAMALLASQTHDMVNLSCPFCPTDVCVTRSHTEEGRVFYQAISWQDFGIEGTLPDPRWRERHFDHIMSESTDFRHDPPPGSIRQLWEESQPWSLSD